MCGIKPREERKTIFDRDEFDCPEFIDEQPVDNVYDVELTDADLEEPCED